MLIISKYLKSSDSGSMIIIMLYRSNQPAKYLTITLLVITVPNIAEAKKKCIGMNGVAEFCQNSKPLNASENRKEVQDSSALELYYSGGIISNSQTSLESKKQLEIESSANVKLTTDKDEQFSEVSESKLDQNEFYMKIRTRFQKLDFTTRKRVQKCLLFGTYLGDVDGLWGRKTFKAITNYEEDLNIKAAKESDQTFNKLKNIFSGKKHCKKMIMDIFKT